MQLPFAGRVTLINGIFSARLWAHQLAPIWLQMLEWSEQIGYPEADTQVTARELLQLAPAGRTAEAAMSRLMPANENASKQLIQIIITCQKRRSQAVALWKEVNGVRGPAFIVLGDPGVRHAYVRDMFITVPAPDNYESLTRKVFEAYVAVRRRFGPAAVLKMDDDCVPGEAPDAEMFSRTVGDADYVGELVGNASFDRTWHIGKCENPAPPVYGLRFRASWARGPLYYLSPRAVDCLVRTYLSYPGEIEAASGFEDKTVGDMLAENGFHLKNTPLWQSTGLFSELEFAPIPSQSRHSETESDVVESGLPAPA